MAWYHPRNVGEYLWRLSALHVVLPVLAVFCLALGELRFDWAERIMGAYLVTTNAGRPASGQIWEVGRQAYSAHQELEKIVTDRIANQRQARESATFVDLAERLQPGQGAMLSVDHFRRLYLDLPEAPAKEMAGPLRLLEILSQGRCDRVYVCKNTAGSGLTIHLLDRGNQVIETLDLPLHLLWLSRESAVLHDGRLEQWPDFQGSIYPAERFFRELGSLPEEVRAAVVVQPRRLLEIDGAIVRVGISNQVSEGYIRLGFEALVAGVPRVLMVRGREWAVWQVQSRLEHPGANGAGFGGRS
ncbi:MAG TPA: hypothetical protein ENF48_05835 [Desulfobacteraceae bacterium]|nr:hypothetical protein [Deltaproteobacteria bacterium]MBW2356810.1 hypothetical protein [Deltaproteobacteria bacterium]RLB95176.1 MAG: hypothetical protein DRH76_08440 [Deltaproteobacteria bacterium]HDI59854.1 hypothetical protein [Desulfobacteraceae bacterium]